MLAESSRSQPPFEKRLDDYLYALNERDDFAMSIIFFHGPCNDGEETANLYFRDWVSICQNASGVEVLWPTAWLAEDVPGARIFSATYDLSLKVTSREGRQDYYLIGENLLGSIFLHAQDYEMWSKPVVLVGHSLGGIVIKELLLQAHRNVAGSGGYDKGRVKQFLDNIILIYYYSTPHSGMSLRVEGESGGPLSLTCTPSRIWKNARFLNVYLSRLQQEFRQMSSLYRIDDKRWRKATIGETSMTKWDLEGIHKVLVPEGSWRGEDCDSYMTADADHFSVCKPTSKTSNNYIDLLSQIEACHYQLRITQHVREAITSVIVSRETSLKKLPSLDLASLVDLKEQLPCYPATALHSQVITQHSRSRLPPIEGNINWYRFHRTLARLNARAGL
ncbi:protein SERAC1 [Marchantia polymorpha subsp. ruderalis]